MNLFIPDIGTRLKLTEDWKFVLQPEHRNEKLFKNLGRSYSEQKKLLVTIPKETILTVRRLYIKQGQAAFSSVTFTITKKSCPNNRNLESSKFWSSIGDVNRIQFELGECDEETLESITSLYDNLKELVPLHQFNKISKIMFEHANLVKIRPQVDGFIYYTDLYDRIENGEKIKRWIKDENIYESVIISINCRSTIYHYCRETVK